jgi:hypothetical protein
MNPLIKCYRCEAQYNGGVQWWTVSYDKGSTRPVPDHWHAPIKMGYCPICRKPPQLEPSPRHTMTAM